MVSHRVGDSNTLKSKITDLVSNYILKEDNYENMRHVKFHTSNDVKVLEFKKNRDIKQSMYLKALEHFKKEPHNFEIMINDNNDGISFIMLTQYDNEKYPYTIIFLYYSKTNKKITQELKINSLDNYIHKYTGVTSDKKIPFKGKNIKIKNKLYDSMKSKILKDDDIDINLNLTEIESQDIILFYGISPKTKIGLILYYNLKTNQMNTLMEINKKTQIYSATNRTNPKFSQNVKINNILYKTSLNYIKPILTKYFSAYLEIIEINSHDGIFLQVLEEDYGFGIVFYYDKKNKKTHTIMKILNGKIIPANKNLNIILSIWFTYYKDKYYWESDDDLSLPNKKQSMINADFKIVDHRIMNEDDYKYIYNVCDTADKKYLNEFWKKGENHHQKVITIKLKGHKKFTIYHNVQLDFYEDQFFEDNQKYEKLFSKNRTFIMFIDIDQSYYIINETNLFRISDDTPGQIAFKNWYRQETYDYIYYGNKVFLNDKIKHFIKRTYLTFNDNDFSPDLPLKFKMNSNKMIVIDRGWNYKKNETYDFYPPPIIDNIKPGLWKSYGIEGDWVDWGFRTKILIATHQDYENISPFTHFNWIMEDQVAIDYAIVAIADLEEYENDDHGIDSVPETIKNKKGVSYGVISSTGIGAGIYGVYSYSDKDKVVAIFINFLYPNPDDDSEDDD